MRSIVALLAIISCFVGVNLQSTNTTKESINTGANTTAGNINSGANTTTGSINTGANTTAENINSGTNTTTGNINSIANTTQGNTNPGANANFFGKLFSTFISSPDAILATIQTVLVNLISETTSTLSNLVRDILLAADNQIEALLYELTQFFSGSPQGITGGDIFTSKPNILN
jgi:hypothetical protein